MTDLLCRVFIRDYQNVKDPKVRESYGKLAGFVGILSNGLLCIVKIIAGIVSGSIAIIADGINNLADASSSVITLIGFRLAAMPEDEEHPYGHARIEYITGMIVSVLIVVVGVELVKSSVEKILHPSPLTFSWFIVAVLCLAIFLKIWQALFNVKVGKKINSVALAATGADSRNDVITTSAVLLSIIIGKFSGLQIDGYMGVLAALFIIWSGIGLIRETVSPLLGEAPDPQLVTSIGEMARSFDGVLGIHDLVVHNYGPGRIFASIHIEVDADGDLMESHDMVDNIEKQISKELHILLTAHMDPVRVNDPVVLKMTDIAEKVTETLEGISSVHDLRVVPGTTHTNVIFDVVMEPGCKLSAKEVCQTFEQAIKKEDPNCFVVINFDKAYVAQL